MSDYSGNASPQAGMLSPLDRHVYTKRNRACIVALCAIFCLPISAQMKDMSGLMDQRMRTIAGENALNCGRVGEDEDPKPALTCARGAISRKQPFVVRFDHSGMDSFLSDGFAGSDSGEAYLVQFDSLGWSGDHVFDDGHNFVDKCRKPTHIRKKPSPKGTFWGFTCVAEKEKD
jgi:hypothetical protein